MQLSCPICGSQCNPNLVSQQPVRATIGKTDLWESLHLYAVQSWQDAERAQEFFVSWQAEVRSQLSGCGCWEKWSKLCEAHPPDFASAEAFFFWSYARHNDVNELLGKPWFSFEDAQRRYRFCAESLVTWDDLTADTAQLAQLIMHDHPDVSGVAGVPRSGMRTATDIALRLGVPLYAACPTQGLIAMPSGLRLRDVDVHGSMRAMADGPTVLVEDSTCSGYSLQEIRSHPALSKLPAYAVYAAVPGRAQLDGYAVALDLPHWFEWNLWNNGQILRDYRVGIDWDGILNEDCPPEFDDDGPKYIRWMNSVRPIRTPTRYTVPYIITGRREVYRSYCEQWLENYGIQYDKLIMYPRSFEERNRDVAIWKAEQISSRGCRLYVESDPHQANLIRHKCDAKVLCPT